MSKILKTIRDGDQVVMTVQLDSGTREKWTYEMEINGDGTRSYLQVNREDVSNGRVHRNQ
jgi:hypothetical protein